MAKAKYVENICCKIFRKMFTMHDIVKTLDIGKADHMTKKFVSYKVKNDNFPGCGKITNLLEKAVEKLISNNEKDFFDRVYDEDSLLDISLSDIDFEHVCSKMFEVNKHEKDKHKFIHITMD